MIYWIKVFSKYISTIFKTLQEIAFTSKAIENDSIKSFRVKNDFLKKKNEVISLSLFIKLESTNKKNFIHKINKMKL